MCQFVFRGAETFEGFNNRRERPCGGDNQWIYNTPNAVAWYELQVWVGVAPVGQGERHGLYDISPVMQDSRRTTRLVKRRCTKLQLYHGHTYNPVAGTLEQTTTLGHTSEWPIYDLDD